MAPLRLSPDMCHQLGTPNPALIVNGRLPRAPPRMHDAFQTGSLTGFREQSFFSPPKARSMGHPHVLSGDLLHSTLRRLQNEMISKTPGHLTSDLYQLPKG